MQPSCHGLASREKRETRGKVATVTDFNFALTTIFLSQTVEAKKIVTERPNVGEESHLSLHTLEL